MEAEKAENRIILNHASTMEVLKPVWNYEHSKERKDLGIGFYTSPDPDYPVLLYCNNDVVILNRYELDLTGLNVLRLKNNVEWLLAVGFHRSNYSRKQNYASLRDTYQKLVSNCDVVVGRITNDNFFSTMDFFFRNIITDYVAINILQVMNYPEQYVFKSDKGCGNLKWIGSTQIDLETLKNLRNEKLSNKEKMNDMVEELRVKLRPSDNGRFISEILAEMINHDTTNI